MARATTKTKLTLDKFAQIIGLDPLHFNQLHSRALEQRDTCGAIWFQYSWQDANRVGREDVARAIQIAEQRIENFIGYDLLPTYRADEEVRVERPFVPGVLSTGLNLRGAAKSVRVDRGYIIGGGVKVKSLHKANASITRSDDDGDGYDETASIVVNSITDSCELHVYFPGVDGADEWEIKPIDIIVSGAAATIIFKSWQIVDPALQEGYNKDPINADNAANYLTSVDVYRIYTDRSQQAEFLWENPENSCGCGDAGCTECMLGSQAGCLTVRDQRLGRFAYRPGTWNAETEKFDFGSYSVGRDPDRMRVSYLSGWMKQDSPCPYTQLDPFWEYTIAYYAASLLDRNICACNNAATFVQNWREEMNRQDDTKSYQLSERQVTNPFGQTRGAMFAWDNCTMPGRRLVVA